MNEKEQSLNKQKIICYDDNRRCSRISHPLRL